MSLKIKLLLCLGFLVLLLGFVFAGIIIGGTRRATEGLEKIRALGEPTRVADIAFDAEVPRSDLHERLKRFGSIHDRSVTISLGDDSVADELTELEHWPEGRSAAPIVAEFLSCIWKEKPAPEEYSWSDLLEACLDPRRLDQLSECERRGLAALRLLNEPCVPAALEVCAATRETGEFAAREWRPALGLLQMDDAPALYSTTITLSATIPALLEDSSTEEARARTDSILTLAWNTRGIPNVMAHLFWMHTVHHGLIGCRYVMASRAETLDWSRARALLADFDSRANFERALIGERAFTIELFQALADGTLSTESDDFIAPGEMPLFWKISNQYDLALYLEIFETALARSRAEEWSPMPDAVDPARFTWWAPMSKLLVPNLDRQRALALVLDAEIRVTRAALEAYEHGAAAAQELAAILRDPFDGQPLRTRLEDGVLVLWSIGPDQIDDGGSSEAGEPEQAGRRFDDARDIVCRVRLR
ncbi:MAG: hypothetical protein JNL28_12045 [Planctomycetes bacterium]|nr:hypothetical protein [Planctomycetota bacterium]